MRMPVIAVWAAVLLTYGVSTGTAMDPKAVAGPSARAGAPAGAGASAGAVIILGDAPDSVDDMYQDCKVQMYQKLQEYLANETKTSQTFKDGWESSEQWYQQNPKNLKPPNMKEQHIVAIHCYTNNSNGVYRDFNTAVRTQGPQYKTTFRYHALHFLLTDAIQTLKGEEKVPCVTVYRRTGSTFEQDGTEIRFSSFTSTSMGNYTDKDYGNKTCFKIYTCFGADISSYSAHPEEREVLIPPYEVFKVAGVKKRSQYKDFPCEVEYELRSTNKSVSHLNCTLFKK